MMSSTNWKMIIRPFPNICARGSDPCSYLPTFAGETIVTFVLDRCFIIRDIHLLLHLEFQGGAGGLGQQ